MTGNGDPDSVADMRPARLAILAVTAAFHVAMGAGVGAGAAADEAGFLSGFEDMPLMAGLEEISGAAVIFDKPGGRIVQGAAAGRLDEGEVARFYAEILPALGWRPTGALSFRREEEQLEITIERSPSDGAVIVHFALSPG